MGGHDDPCSVRGNALASLSSRRGLSYLLHPTSIATRYGHLAQATLSGPRVRCAEPVWLEGHHRRKRTPPPPCGAQRAGTNR
jgi:hypothetical protein